MIKLFKKLSDSSMRDYTYDPPQTQTNDELFVELFGIPLEPYDVGEVEAWPENVRRFDVQGGQIVFTLFTAGQTSRRLLDGGFSVQRCFTAIFESFSARAFAVSGHLSLLKIYAELRQFESVRDFSAVLAQRGIITAGELTTLKQIFLANGVDLDNLPS